MLVLYYILFQTISLSLLFQIYRLSSYHQFFFKSLPLLVGYSILAGFLLYHFELHSFFIWYLIITSVALFSTMKDQSTKSSMFASSFPASQQPILKDSINKTKKYYLLSSLTHLAFFSITYLYLFNVL